MDVRCEKCRTEYELDESKLKPSGVTVKCTNCGHMFKVRRRITAIGPAVTGPPTLRGGGQPLTAPTPEPPAPPRPAATPPDPVAGSQDEVERTWLIRLEDGEILTCRELATLQKWIVAGRVSRGCEISRTGKKWKTLGDIGELASFFDIADEARQVGEAAPQRAPTAHPHTVPRAPTGSAPAAAASPLVSPASQPAPVAAPMPASLAEPEPPRSEPAASAPPRLEEADDDRATGAWAAQGRIRPPSDDGFGGPTMRSAESEAPPGPSRGVARPMNSSDAAFAGGGHIGDRKGEFENGAFIPTDEAFDDLRPPTGGLGRWIAIISILAILGGGVAIYMVLFRDDGSETAAALPAPDAAAAPVAAIDAAAPPQPTGDVDGAVIAAAAARRGDTRAGIENALATLEPFVKDPAAAAPTLLAAAGLQAALAQHLVDEADDAERSSVKKRLITEARERATRVESLVTRAEELDAKNPQVMVARADALRLRGRPAREVERWLRRALAADANNREAQLSRALLYVRDREPRQARRLLEHIESVAGDVRPAYRLARLDAADKSYDDANKRLDEVLAAEPEHAGAVALKERIGKALAAGATDSTPPEQHGEPENEHEQHEHVEGIDSYDHLLARADKLSENGHCDRAKPIYKKALEANPGGVAALTGLGYCYLDSRQFASAHAKFRAALGISSRYSGALWGMGELYERQGLKPQAIAAFKRFIEAHPTSPRAATAKRRIEKLGGSAGGDEAGQGSGSGSGSGSEQGGGEQGGGEQGGGDGAGSNVVQPEPKPSGASGGDEAGSGSGSASAVPDSPATP